MVPIDGTTLVDHRVFVLAGDQEAFDGPATFEVGLNAISTTYLFDTFTKTLFVGYHNVTLIFNFIGDRLGSCSALVANPIIDLTGRPVESFLHLVQSPFRMGTHTDQYLQWDSHHHLSAKFSVIHTLSHRVSTVCSKPELLQQEKDHLRKAFTKCKYPKWALDKVEKRLNRSTSEVNDGVSNQGTTAAQPVTNEIKNKGHIVIPYTQGPCESIKKICGRYGIQTHFKGGRTIKSLLISCKDKDPMVNQSGAIYWYQCGDLGCDDEYIG